MVCDNCGEQINEEAGRPVSLAALERNEERCYPCERKFTAADKLTEALVELYAACDDDQIEVGEVEAECHHAARIRREEANN